MKSKIATFEQWTATSSELAQLLNLSTRRVQQLVQAGLLPPPGPEGHQLAEGIPAYCRLLQRPSQSKDLAEARQRLIEVQTKIREVELRQKSGALVSREAIDKEWFRIGREIRDALMNLPSRLAGIVSAEKSQEKNYQIIEKEVRQCLESLTGQA